jgi:hypothetical protein
MALEVGYGLGAALLLAGLAWGYVSYRTRNRANDRITEAATRAEYKEGEKYPERRQALNKQIRPS